MSAIRDRLDCCRCGEITAAGAGLEWSPPTLKPQSPLLSQEVEDLTQTWYIGSTTNGDGIPVQFDNITYYQDHGRHLSVTSPVR